MSWYPGKYAAKATAAATKAARAAAEVTRTTVEKEAEAARKQAEKALADAYAEAQSTWEAARDEAMSALGKGGALDDFEERARSIAHEHKDLVGLARRTADQISLSAYENAARSLISAGAITTESQAVDLTQQVYAPSSSASELRAATKEKQASDGLQTLSVCNNAAAGLAVGVEGAGLGPPILRHDVDHWVPMPYREGSVCFGGIVAASCGATVGVFRRPANRQWGNFIAITWAADAEGPGAHLTVYFGLEDGEFDGIDVGVEASAGSPVNIYGSVGRTVRLPVLYPTSLYD